MIPIMGAEPLTLWQQLAIDTVKVLLLCSALLGLFSGLTWAERRLLAFMQFRLGPNRTGPMGLLQPIADGIKLFFKEEAMPAGASKWAFLAAPVVAVTTAFTAIAVVPYGPPLTLPAPCAVTDLLSRVYNFTGGLLPQWLQGREISLQIVDLDIGLLFLFAMSSLSVYGLVLAGWSANNKYSLLGGLRSSAQMFSYELALGLSWTGLIMVAGSFKISEIVGYQAGGVLFWNFLHHPLAFLIYCVAATAEVSRTPFDLPEAEQELVAGFHTEYSSMRFALMQMAEYVNIITVAWLVTNLFFGGWYSPVSWLPDSFLWSFGKAMAVIFVFIWLRGTLPRFRYDQLMAFGWKVLIPAVTLNVLLTAGLVLLGWERWLIGWL
jgi:NADH-quinone oxidoreductase subunit H